MSKMQAFSRPCAFICFLAFETCDQEVALALVFDILPDLIIHSLKAVTRNTCHG